MADEHLSIWLRPERQQRGPRPAYTRTQIAETAVRIADKDGLEAVSMRRVAAELGAGTMSLYRYVLSRDELIEVMQDLVIQELDLPDRPGADWRADLTLFAHRSRAMMLRHRWMATVPGMRPFWGPGYLRLIEFGYGTLDRFGLPIDQVIVLFDILSGFVLTAVQNQISAIEVEERTGLSMEQLMARHGPLIRELIQSPDHRALRRIVIDAQQPHQEWDERFEYGLNQVLDTISAALTASAGTEALSEADVMGLGDSMPTDDPCRLPSEEDGTQEQG